MCDDIISTVGTLNVDNRSLFLNFECGLYVYKSKEILNIKKDFLDTLEKCHKENLDELKSGFWKRFKDSVLRVFAPLL